MTTEENLIPDEASVTLNVRYGYQDNDFRQSIDLPAGEHPTAQQLSHLLIGVFDAAAASENLELHAGEKPRAHLTMRTLMDAAEQADTRARPVGQVVPPAWHYPVETLTADDVRDLLQRKDRELAAAVEEAELQRMSSDAARAESNTLRQQFEDQVEKTYYANRRAERAETKVRELGEKIAEQTEKINRANRRAGRAENEADMLRGKIAEQGGTKPEGGPEIDAKYYPVETLSPDALRELLQRKDRELADALRVAEVRTYDLNAARAENAELNKQMEALQHRFEVERGNSEHLGRQLNAARVEAKRAQEESRKHAAVIEELNKQLDDTVRTSTAHLNERRRLAGALHQIAGIAQESGNA